MQRKATTLAFALLALGTAAPASANDTPGNRADSTAPMVEFMNTSGNHGVSTSPMVEFMNSGRVPGANDVSKLLRRTDWVDVEIQTSGLDPSTAYTAWAVIFNKPQHCAASPCGLGDLPIIPGHDPRLLASVTYVSGGVSGADGRLRLAGRLDRARHGGKPTETLFGPGLIHGAKAEIHFVLRGHGPKSGDPLLAIGSYGAGCSTSNPCSDQQATIHLAPR